MLKFRNIFFLERFLHVNIEEKVWLLVKITDFQRLILRLKLCLMMGIGLHWNQVEKVTLYSFIPVIDCVGRTPIHYFAQWPIKLLIWPCIKV
jgi:hypothetical protein